MLRWLRSDAAVAALLMVLLVQSVRPIAPVERALAELSGLAGHLARFTSPLARLVRRGFDAEDPELLVRRQSEERAARAFLQALFESASPTDAALLEGRRRVPAAVVRRPSGRTDELIVRPWTTEELRPGLPVVHRDVYVGRVDEVWPETGELRVKLVTGRDTFVGARVLPPARLLERGLATEGDAVDLVIGGVVVEGRGPLSSRRTLLAAHNPGRERGAFRRGELRGRVTVHELLPELDRWSELAEGYGLGELVRGEGEEDWRVEPEVDYLSGLFHVVVLAPEVDGVSLAPPPEHPLSDERWVPATGTSVGDLTPAGHAVQLNRGTSGGVARGAAVVRGVRLIGRIREVSRGGAEVALLFDRGVELPAACELLVSGRPAGEGLPRVLGRITSLGARDGSSAVRFHWRDVLPIEPELGDGDGFVTADVYTGSGESGLPAGLLLGRARIPVGSSGGRGHVIEFTDLEPWRAGEAEVWVRRAGGGGAR